MEQRISSIFIFIEGASKKVLHFFMLLEHICKKTFLFLKNKMFIRNTTIRIKQ